MRVARWTRAENLRGGALGRGPMTNSTRGGNPAKGKDQRQVGFEMTPDLEAYLKAKNRDPETEMTEGARRALDACTDEDLSGFAKQVKARVGKPMHLTPEQEAAFRASGGDLPTVTRADGGAGAGGYRPPPGKFAAGTAGGGPACGSMKNAWDRFEGSFESFKAGVLRPDPDHLHVGLQQWVVVTRIGEPLVDRMAQKVSGAFATAEEAESHATRVREEFPWFDVDVLSMYHFIPYPTTEEVKRGVRRVYDDENLTATMRAHFEQNTASKAGQMERVAKARERASDPGKFEEADRVAAESGKQGEYPRMEFVPNAIDDECSGVYDDVRCRE
ncbi:hypothetical protein WJX74_007994 [Apatococcus lobatus]|uniref:Uncharacterized protein n=1 Tax=Apatococcus lobatus TaxID=904363 RepID=A0AAW1SG12_9CHLO